MAIPSGGGATKTTTPPAPFTYPVLSGKSLAAIQPTAARPAAPPTLDSLAAAMAQRDTNAELAAYRDQQAAYQADARARAAAINQMALGAAGFLRPLGDITKQDYADALAQNTGLAQGYSGQLRTDAQAAADQAQATLRSIPGNTQTLTNQGSSLADLLYGLRGSLPGQALVTEGLGATAAARALPASSLAYGQTQAVNALNAGRQDARSLDAQIAAATGKLPGLTQQYLGDLVSQQQKQQQAALETAKFKADQTYKAAYLTHLQAGDTERVAHDRAMEAAGLSYHDALLGLASGRLDVSQYNADTSRINAKTARINANKPPASQAGPTGPPHFDSTNSNTNKYRSDQYGNSLGGKITPLPGYKRNKDGTGVVPAGSSKSGAKLLTGTDLANEIQVINAGVITMKTGIDPKTGKPPLDLLTGQPLLPITSRADAIAEARAAGYFASPQLTRIVMKAINRIWPKPVKGPGSALNLFGAAGQQTAKAATTR